MQAIAWALEGWRTVRARANPLSLEVWHFALRFALPEVGLDTPADLERRAVDHWTQSLPATRENHLAVDTSSEIVGREAGATHMLARTPRATGYARVSLQ